MDYEQQVTVIKRVLSDLQPMVARDGGNIQFVKLENNTVFVRLEGACVSCPSSFFTLKFGLEEAIRQQLPGIKDVVPVE